MKILHTSDWHLGKVLKGVSRLEEQRSVMDEVLEIARAEAVDLALVAGDVFESAAPVPEAQRLAWDTILGFREAGAETVVIAGNHDHGAMFDALRPLAAAAGVHLLGRPLRRDEGGQLRLRTRSGEEALLACLPFLSQRFVVRSELLMTEGAAAHAATYAERYRAVVASLCEGFGNQTVNLVLSHAFARGGVLGGGERDAQTIEDYWVDASAYPPSTQYVALGHLHRTQQIPGAAPVWYSGSPIQVDFGEGGEHKHVLLVEAAAGKPARVTEHRLTTPRRLRTLEGNLAQLAAAAAETEDDLLRVVVDEPARAGLANEVRELLPQAIDIRIRRGEERSRARAERSGRSPHELFSAYLAESEIVDERLEHLFAELLAELSESPT